MKLFHFNPNDYGEEAYVCAETREDAIKALKNTKPDRTPEQDVACNCTAGSSKEYHDRIVAAMISGKPLYEGGKVYTIDEYPVGHVFFSEIA